MSFEENNPLTIVAICDEKDLDGNSIDDYTMTCTTIEKSEDFKVKFKLGNLYVTRGVAAKTEEDRTFFMEILDCFSRYQKCDWGDMGEEDKYLNDEAVRTGETRILSLHNCKDNLCRINFLYRLDKDTYPGILFLFFFLATPDYF